MLYKYNGVLNETITKTIITMNKKANPEDVKKLQITIKLTRSDLDRLEMMANCNEITKASVIRTLIWKTKPCDL